MFENIPKIPQRIRFFRLLKGTSQTKMSRAIGKSHTYINRVENGAKIPKTATIMKICQYFDISIKDFFDFDIEAVEKAGLLDIVHETTNLKKRHDAFCEKLAVFCKENQIFLP